MSNIENNSNHPNVFVTSPSSGDTWNSQPQKQQDIMIASMNQNQQDQLQNYHFQMGIPDALPPSPAPSVVLQSPSSPYDDEHNYEQNFSQQSTLNLEYPEQ